MSESDNKNIIIGSFERQARTSEREWREQADRYARPSFNEQVLAIRRNWEAGASYSVASANLYENLTGQGQMVTIAAPSGQGKSLLATNAAAYAIQDRGRVLWVNLDMPLITTSRRLVCMLTGLSMDELNAMPDVLRSTIRDLANRGLWHVLDMLTSPPRSHIEWENMFGLCEAAGRLDVVVIDGFDRVCTGLTSQEFTERCHYAATWAEIAGVSLIATSQTTKSSVNAEIIDVNDLAFSAGKAYASDLVVTIGHGAHSEMRTASIAKDRNRLFADGQVFRLGQAPSLRMDVLEVDDVVPVRGPNPDTEPEFVNCKARDAELADADAEGEIADGGDDRGAGSTKLYHGTRGHVSIGREVFTSAAFRSGDWESLGRLLSLYEMAAITETRLHAPNTRVPVTIQRGQIMTSARMLGKLWGVDKNQAERFLQQLERDGLIETEHVRSDHGASTAGTKNGTKVKVLATIVTLCHYDANDGANQEYGRKLGQQTGQR
jgi:hypothetical protein